MKKITAKRKAKKVRTIGDTVVPEIDIEDHQAEPDQPESELDPEILKVFIKPKKTKSSIDTTDYVPELERGEEEEGYVSGQDQY